VPSWPDDLAAFLSTPEGLQVGADSKRFIPTGRRGPCFKRDEPTRKEG